MKKTDLEKNKGLKIMNELKQGAAAQRLAAGATVNRKEQRKLDQAKGLVPFAVKLDSDLVKEIRDRAVTDQVDLNELVGQLLRKALHDK